MPMLAELIDHVVGVDPDRDRITAAVVDAHTHAELDRIETSATPAGYDAVMAWADTHTTTQRRVWSVEGTASYGAGLFTTLQALGEWVVEFDRPSTRPTRDGAKSDGLDAVRAARELLGRRRWSQPRCRGLREAIRVTAVTRAGADRARTAAVNELRAVIVAAPPALREDLRHLTRAQLLSRCERFRIADPTSETAATRLVLRHLARRIGHLTAELAAATATLETLVSHVAPQLLDEPGVGPVTAAGVIMAWSHPGRCRSDAAFARLAGTAPIDATSGHHQNRHRLNRGGDRQLNRAIHTIVVTRLRIDPTTRAYVQRRIQEGKTPREARRCLKRYITRRLWRLLEHPPLDAT